MISEVIEMKEKKEPWYKQPIKKPEMVEMNVRMPKNIARSISQHETAYGKHIDPINAMMLEIVFGIMGMMMFGIGLAFGFEDLFVIGIGLLVLIGMISWYPILREKYQKPEQSKSEPKIGFMD